jgi:hypothetical protein
MAEAEAPVDLDSLTTKQLAKQFKSVAKEVRSKDVEVKTNVLVKLTNHRYFFDGGCLPPFFESLAPKKVSGLSRSINSAIIQSLLLCYADYSSVIFIIYTIYFDTNRKH